MVPITSLGSCHVFFMTDVEAARSLSDVRFFAGGAVVSVNSLLFFPVRSRFIFSAEDVLELLTRSDKCVAAGLLKSALKFVRYTTGNERNFGVWAERDTV